MARKKPQKKKAPQKTVSYKSADQVATAEGRQYHIDLAPGEVAPYILLCGDPARAAKAAGMLDSVRCERSNREYITFTGTYKGIEVSAMGTGIGPDNTEIAVIELCQIVKNPTFLRVGSCGALQAGIKLGDLVISTGAVRLENTSTYFVPEGYPAVADYEVVVALASACGSMDQPVHLGITATAPGFYGAQARKVPGFPVRFPDLPDQLAKIGVVNLEMEVSSLLTLASVGKARAGAICTVFANRPHNQFADSVIKEKGEESALKVGLAAFEILARMDEWKKMHRKEYWHV